MEYGNRIQEWWDVLKPKVLQAFTRLEIDEELIHIMDDTLFELGEAANDFKVTHCCELAELHFRALLFVQFL